MKKIICILFCLILLSSIALASEDKAQEFAKKLLEKNKINVIVEDTGKVHGITMEKGLTDPHEKPSANLHTRKEIIEKVLFSKDPQRELINAYLEGDVTLKGVGFLNRIKFFFVDKIAKLTLPKVLEETNITVDQDLVLQPFEGLRCPQPNDNTIDWPVCPYDLTDCDMLGKEEEVETYFDELYAMVDECYVLRDDRWEQLQDQRDDILEQLNEIYVESDSEFAKYFTASEYDDRADDLGEPSNWGDNYGYTDYILGMKGDIEIICNKVNNMNERLIEECEDIKEELENSDEITQYEKDLWIAQIENIWFNETTIRESTEHLHDHSEQLYANFYDYIDYDDIQYDCDCGFYNENGIRRTTTISEYQECEEGPAIEQMIYDFPYYDPS